MNEASETRGAFYSLFSQLLHVPNSNVDAMIQAFNGIPELGQVSVNHETLEYEYNRLFVGPGHVPCPPYESVYRKDRPLMERGLVMGPSVADVKAMYLKGGLEISKNFRDLPDHMSVELEFMAYLCSTESSSEKLVDLEREFFNKHIRVWYRDFLNCIIANTKSPFYLKLAHELEEFLNEESVRFGEKA
jgi:TorA maturation chaperone TorD